MQTGEIPSQVFQQTRHRNIAVTGPVLPLLSLTLQIKLRLVSQSTLEKLALVLGCLLGPLPLSHENVTQHEVCLVCMPLWKDVVMVWSWSVCSGSWGAVAWSLRAL